MPGYPYCDTDLRCKFLMPNPYEMNEVVHGSALYENTVLSESVVMHY